MRGEKEAMKKTSGKLGKHTPPSANGVGAERLGQTVADAAPPVGECKPPLEYVLRALKVLQTSNFKAITTGQGRGNTTPEMALILDRELGFSDLYAALEQVETWWLEQGMQLLPGAPACIFNARAALAKARGEK